MVELLIAGYWHGWSIIRVCVGKMPFNRPFLSLLREEARHPMLPRHCPLLVCVFTCVWRATLWVGEAVGGGAVGTGTERLHHLTAALVTPAGNHYHHPCYPGSQSGGLIVLYLWFIFIMIKLVRVWTEGVAAGWHHPAAHACGDQGIIWIY